MATDSMGLTLVIFGLTLVGTFTAAILGRRHSKGLEQSALTDQNLNKWFVGLSAGATANSGFIVTGAVGLGYLYGLQWLLLPIAWLLGDMVFWKFFPDRINRFGTESRATTLSEIITHGLPSSSARVLTILCAIVVLVCLGGYTMAQWVAGQKFLAGAFDFSGVTSSLFFAALIVIYTTIGGFRGSVYADTFQSVIRLIGTLIALGTIIWFAWAGGDTVTQNIASAGTDFLHPLGGGTLIGAAGFIAGYAAAALGFGLGQPQIVSRYLAGRDPAETRAAWWIYIGFVQFTWISMTIFGLLLRGVMPGIEDPETGFSLFFQQNMPSIITGLILADVFATMAATSNSLLVSMTQTVTRDLLPLVSRYRFLRVPVWTVSLTIGAVTMVLSLIGSGTVVSLALTSVSLMGAGLAPVIMIKVLKWQHSAMSLGLAIVAGFLSSVVWKILGLDSIINEAAIGIAIGLIVNYLAAMQNKTLRITNRSVGQEGRRGVKSI